MPPVDDEVSAASEPTLDVEESPRPAGRRALDDASARKACLDAYELVLARAPDPDVLDATADALTAGDLTVPDLLRDLIDFGAVRSKEARAAHETQQARQFVEDLYRSVFDRSPDEGGLTSFTNELVSGAMSPLDAVRSILGSDEWRARQKPTAGDAGTDIAFVPRQWVCNFFDKILLRAPDPDGLSVYTEALSSGTLQPMDFIAQLVESPEFGQAALRHWPVACFVARTTIQTLMARDPGREVVETYAASLQSGYGLAQFLEELIGSEEFADRMRVPHSRHDDGAAARDAENLIVAHLVARGCKLALPPSTDPRAPIGERQVRSMLLTIAKLQAA